MGRPFHSGIEHVYQRIKGEKPENERVIPVVNLVEIQGPFLPIRGEELRCHADEERI